MNITTRAIKVKVILLLLLLEAEYPADLEETLAAVSLSTLLSRRARISHTLQKASTATGIKYPRKAQR